MPAFERESRCICLGLQRHERGASFSVKKSYLHQRRMQAYETTPKKDEPGSEGHSQRRVAETIECRVHISYIRQWMGIPLFLVPNKNGKCIICVDYRELNKATKKYDFLMPFIDQVLDGLMGKKLFFFLDGFSGYNQIQISPEDQDKTSFTYPWGTFSYIILPFQLWNAPNSFQRPVLSISSELFHDSVEIYMDDFTPYGDDF